MICSECHHLPSERFNSGGVQCYCRCHDVADAGPELLAACKTCLARHKQAYELRQKLSGIIGGKLAEEIALVEAAIDKAEGRTP